MKRLLTFVRVDRRLIRVSIRGVGPLGATGAKLTVQLMHEMKRRQSRYGMVTMCIGGGMGAAGA